MSKQRKIGLIFLISFFSISAFYTIYNRDCEWWDQISGSSEMAKENDVFVASLMPTKKTLSIGDSIKLVFTEVWLEKVWSSNCRGEIRESRGQHGSRYQICAKTESDVIEKSGFSIEWVFGTNDRNYWRRCGKNAITTYLDFIPTDTLFYPIQIGSNLSPNGEKNIIDTIGFYKIN